MVLMTFLATWWFWLVVLEIALIFWFLALDHGDWASYSLIVFLVLLWFIPGGADFFKWIAANPKTVGWVALAYFPIGAIWGVVKWLLFAYDRLDEYKTTMTEFPEHYDNRVSQLRSIHESKHAKKKKEWEIYGDSKNEEAYAELKEKDPFVLPNRDKEMKDFLNRQLGHSWSKKYPPQISDHKGDYIRWLSYWPFSLLYTLTHDFIRRIARAFYNAISKYLQSISDWVFSHAKVDIPKP